MRIVPPGSGIVHQVNLEYLARVVFTAESTTNGECVLYVKCMCAHRCAAALSGLGGRHRLAHDYDLWTRCARLGRRRH
jgi:hypothetical protein